MKLIKIISISLVFSMAIISILAFTASSQELLNIKISNIKKNGGKVIVEIYNSKSNWLKKPYQKVELTPNYSIQTASFKVPYGKYAVTVYQDLNNNGETDMNFLGIPKELVGFGNNYKPFGEPKFKSALINFDVTFKQQEIKLYKVL